MNSFVDQTGFTPYFPLPCLCLDGFGCIFLHKRTPQKDFNCVVLKHSHKEKLLHPQHTQLCSSFQLNIQVYSSSSGKVTESSRACAYLPTFGIYHASTLLWLSSGPLHTDIRDVHLTSLFLLWETHFWLILGFRYTFRYTHIINPVC